MRARARTDAVPDCERWRPGHQQQEPLSAGEGLAGVLWQVEGSNLCRLSRLIYSLLPPLV